MAQPTVHSVPLIAFAPGYHPDSINLGNKTIRLANMSDGIVRADAATVGQLSDQITDVNDHIDEVQQETIRAFRLLPTLEQVSYLYELLQRLILNQHENGLVLNDDTLLNELEEAIKTINK